MGLAIQVLLLGPPSTADERIREAVAAIWRGGILCQAPDMEAAMHRLTAIGSGGVAAAPDLIIAKVSPSATAQNEIFGAIRRHKLFRDTPTAAFVDGANPGEFRCLRGSGVTAVLTRQRLEEQLADIVDAVVDNWLVTRNHDCSARYFCPVCAYCVMTRPR